MKAALTVRQWAAAPSSASLQLGLRLKLLLQLQLPPHRGAVAGLLVALVAALAACETAPPAAPATGLSELIAQPAERALFDGIRAYDEGQYGQAETALQNALQTGLRSPRDQATAHKLLAFIACTSNRLAGCEAAFRAARRADPDFALSRSEAGHPLWGPVYLQSAR